MSGRCNPAMNAKRLGVSVEEYEAHRANGEHYCYTCKTWYPRIRLPKSQEKVGFRCQKCIAQTRDSPNAPEAPIKTDGNRANYRRHYRLTGAMIHCRGPVGPQEWYVLTCETHGVAVKARGLVRANRYFSRSWRWCPGCETARAQAAGNVKELFGL